MAEEAAFILDGGPDGAIPVWYPDGSPGMSVYDRIDNEKGKQLVIGYRVEDQHRIRARRIFKGTTIYTGPGHISRILPHYVDWDEPDEDDTVLWCADAKGVPGGPLRESAAAHPLNPPVHTDANITVTYTSRKYTLLDDAAVTIDGVQDELLRFIDYPPPRVKTCVRTAKGATWIWVDGPNVGKDAIDATFINDSEIEWAIQWLQVPAEAVPWTTIMDYLESVNTVPFSRYDFAAGRARFSGFGEEEISLPNGRDGVNMTYLFCTKRHTHNAFPDKDDGWLFHEVTAKNLSGNKPHVARDHRNLFKPL